MHADRPDAAAVEADRTPTPSPLKPAANTVCVPSRITAIAGKRHVIESSPAQ